MIRLIWIVFPLLMILNSGFSQQKTKNDTIYTVVDTEPEYTEGKAGMHRVIMRNLDFPLDALQKGIEGTVLVQVLVNTDGFVGEVKCVKGIFPACDAAAVHAVSFLRKWTPAKRKGKSVRYRVTVPVLFNQGVQSQLLANHDRGKGLDDVGLPDPGGKQDTTIHTVVDKPPHYPGGPEAMNLYFHDMMKLPPRPGPGIDKGIIII